MEKKKKISAEELAPIAKLRKLERDGMAKIESIAHRPSSKPSYGECDVTYYVEGGEETLLNLPSIFTSTDCKNMRSFVSINTQTKRMADNRYLIRSRFYYADIGEFDRELQSLCKERRNPRLFESIGANFDLQNAAPVLKLKKMEADGELRIGSIGEDRGGGVTLGKAIVYTPRTAEEIELRGQNLGAILHRRVRDLFDSIDCKAYVEYNLHRVSDERTDAGDEYKMTIRFWIDPFNPKNAPTQMRKCKEKNNPRLFEDAMRTRFKTLLHSGIGDTIGEGRQTPWEREQEKKRWEREEKEEAAEDARYIANNSPLNSDEIKELKMANEFMMDIDAGEARGEIPKHIDQIANLPRKKTPSEARTIIRWAYHAGGF